MSKQLTISSSFATFALAALALLHTPPQGSGHDFAGSGMWQAESASAANRAPGLPFALPRRD